MVNMQSDKKNKKKVQKSFVIKNMFISLSDKFKTLKLWTN